MGFFNILVLCPLGAATQQQDQGDPLLRTVDPVARTVIDPQFVDAATDAFPVTAKVFSESVQPGGDAQTRGTIPQIIEPFGDWDSTVWYW
jgi:hypothetical protein